MHRMATTTSSGTRHERRTLVSVALLAALVFVVDVLLPLGVALVIRLTPAALWQVCLLEAEASAERLPRLWWGALLVLAVWLILFALFLAWLLNLLAAA